MPFLRRKSFVAEGPPPNLGPNDEVFFLEVTGEAFINYDAFFERMILCNSLLWSCEYTGKSGLTYNEALSSEANVRKSVGGIQEATKRALLTLVHHTKRSRIADLIDEIYDYVRRRYLHGEEVEVKIKDEWKKGTVVKSPNNLLSTTLENLQKSKSGASALENTPNKIPNKDKIARSPCSPTSLRGPTLISTTSTIDKKSSWPDPDHLQYDVKLKKDGNPEFVISKGKLIRRIKGSLSKDLIKLLLRQTCMRSTPSSDDGYWIVLERYIAKYNLGKSLIGRGPLQLETPVKFKKRKRSDTRKSGDDVAIPEKKAKTDNSSSTVDQTKVNKKEGPVKDIKRKKRNKKQFVKNDKEKAGRKNDKEKARRESKAGKWIKTGSSKTKNSKGDTKSKTKNDISPSSSTPNLNAMKDKDKENKLVMTPEERQMLVDQLKLRKEEDKKKRFLEREEERKKRNLEKEMEKQRKKTEREKERVFTHELRKLEADFLKEWNRPKEDLKLEDLKALPDPLPVDTKVPQELFGDVLMVLEFLNIFGPFYEIEEELAQIVTFDYLEIGLLEHNAEGNYYDVVKYLMKTFYRVSQEENEEHEEESASSTGTNTPAEPAEPELRDENTQLGKASASAAAAAAWPMLHQGKALHELTIEPFSLSEILRLHILSSGIKIGGGLRNNWHDWQRRGGFQYSDDPCVDFRHKEGNILRMLQTSSVYDLPAADKLKILCVLCDQLLTLQTSREYIEDAFERVKELKKELRDLQHKEHKRRKLEAAEKWRKRMEECARRKEEVEKRKKEKLAREGMENPASKDSPNADGNKKATKEGIGNKEEAKKAGIEWVVDDSSKVNLRQSNRKVKGKEIQEKKTGENMEIDAPDKVDQTDAKQTKTKWKEPPKSEGQEKVEENMEIDNKTDCGKDTEMATNTKQITVEGTDVKKEEISPEEERERRKKEKFKEQEQKIVKELARYSAICSETPVGKDRTYKRYWTFWAVHGFFIENDKTVNEDVLVSADDEFYIDEDDGDVGGDATSKADDESVVDSVTDDILDDVQNAFPEVSLSDIFKLKSNGESCCGPLFTRYKCKMDDVRKLIIPKSQLLSTIIEDVEQSINPTSCISQDGVLWSTYRTKEDIENLITRLNSRGFRESNLKSTLQKESGQIYYKTENNFLYRLVKLEQANSEEIAKTKPGKADRTVDKSLFKSMNDYLEANLRDQILELEDRLWQGGLCVIKVEDRYVWRNLIEKGIEYLLWGNQQSSQEKSTSMGNGDINVGNNEAIVKPEEQANEHKATEVKLTDGIEEKKPTLPLINGLGDSPQLTLKNLPLKFVESENVKKDRSRCSTPTPVLSTPMISSIVKELSNALLLIEAGIEGKFLKPPLGDDEETRKGKIKEMIQAAAAEFDAMVEKKKEKSKNKNETENGETVANGQKDDCDNDSVISSSSEELKKERTLTERWRSSLASVTNISQIFIHLDSLERSIMWDKSVLNARCRLCKRKGDAEHMLLCDGCDRGFHMYCLKPPIKNVPTGDWFCHDCKPKEPRRINRLKKRAKVEEIEEEKSSDDEQKSESEEEDDESEEEDSDKENEEDSDESESESEEESSEEIENADICSVCNLEGTLICCDACPRAYHVACTYPPMKKVPKGDWSCQVCTGAEDELPRSKRVKIQEKEREKAAKMNFETANLNSSSSKSSSQTQSKLKPKSRQNLPTASQKRGTSPLSAKKTSPPSAKRTTEPNKKSRLESQAQSSRRKSKSPSVNKSSPKKNQPTKRTSISGFGRYERRQCSKILEELMQSDDGEPFLMPVDTKSVPDYPKYIDKPMDFQSIKRSLNTGIYDNLHSFLSDVQLVFSNCETYNPPRSNVARSGSRLSLYFEQRIRELELVNDT